MGNVRDIGSALGRYCMDNNDLFPVAAHPEATDPRVGLVEYTQAIGSYRGRADDPMAGNTALMSPLPTKLSTTRSLWILFREKRIRREQFICPSTQDRPNDEPQAANYWDFGVGDIAGEATPEQSRQGYHQVSYGYQVPYGKHARASLDSDHNVIVADKGPFGVAIEDGAPAPPPFSASAESPDDTWRPWNSPNHGGPGRGESQFGFTSAMLGGGFSTPSKGMLGYENCYTRQSGDWSRIEDRIWGDPPTPGARYTPCASPTDRSLPFDGDVLIYP